jgi:hypothetical protein
MREPLSYDIARSAAEGGRVAGVAVRLGGVMKVALGADGTGPHHVARPPSHVARRTRGRRVMQRPPWDMALPVLPVCSPTGTCAKTAGMPHLPRSAYV